MKLAPSKNPEKESKTFAILGLTSGLIGLFLGFISIVAIAFSARGLILSKRVGSKSRMTMSIIGLILGGVGLIFYTLNT